MPNLLDLGFSIFPVTAGAKSPPLVNDFPRVASNDPKQIRTWMKQFPGCNFAIHCKDMVVIDVDTKNGGPQTLSDLKDLWDLPPTLEAETPTGGTHIFYKGASVPNGAHVLGPGVDIRSDRGYVVAPGSSVPAGKYKWKTDRSIATAPNWVVTECLRQVTPKSDERELPAGVIPEQAEKRALDFLADREPAIEGNGGDQWTYQTICYLRDCGVEQTDIPYVMAEWNTHCLPPWTDEELARKAAGVYKYAQNPAGKDAVEADFSDVSHMPERQREAADPLMYRPAEIDLADALKTDYLVKGWLDRTTQAVLFGKWGAGKTFNALHMGAHIAAGREWFGQRVRQGGVLFLAYEGEAAIKKRLAALMAETVKNGWEWRDIPFYIRHMNSPLVLKRTSDQSVMAKGAEILQRCMEDIHEVEGTYPSLIVVDPMRNALGGSDSDVEYTQPYLEYAKGLSIEYGCAVLTVHHPGHGEGMRSRGDSGIEASMDTVIRVDGEMYSIASTKQRDSIKGTLYYNLRVVELGEDDDGDLITSCVVDQISDSADDPNLTPAQREFLDTVLESQDGNGLIKKSAVQSAMSELSASSRVEFVKLLCKKKFLIQDDKGYWAGGGPVVDMFKE